MCILYIYICCITQMYMHTIKLNQQWHVLAPSHSNTSKHATTVRSVTFFFKAPVTHQFQNTGKFCDIINQKRPLNGCASRCLSFVNMERYTRPMFLWCFLFFFVNVQIHAAWFGPRNIVLDVFRLFFDCCKQHRVMRHLRGHDWPRVEKSMSACPELVLARTLILFCIHTEIPVIHW